MDSLDSVSVCIVGMHFTPESTGNAPYTAALARALALDGARVRVITGVPHYPQWRLQDDRYLQPGLWEEDQEGVRVTRCWHSVPQTPTLRSRSVMDAQFAARAVRQVAADSSDLIIAVTPTLAGLAAGVVGRWRGRRPLGVLVQDLVGNAAGQSGASSRRLSSVIGAVEYGLIRRADRVGVITARFGEVLVRHGVDAHRVVQLPNFSHVVASAESTREARRHLGWPGDPFTVVHTGNQGLKQGLENMVEAARLSHQSGENIMFVLVGDGNQRNRLQEQAGGLPNVRFVDPLSAAGYPSALAAADVLLLNERPGVLDMSMPSKLTSYSVSHRPVLACVEPRGITHAALSEYGAAILVLPGSPEALLAAVLTARLDEELCARVVRGAHAMHKELYDPDSAYRRYQEFARELADVAIRRGRGPVQSRPISPKSCP